MSQDALELMTRVRRGDEEALVDLHARYASMVYSVALRVLNDPMTAEEITQDTFMRVWDRANTFDPNKGAFVTWLLTITRRLAIDHFRKLRRSPMRDPLFVDGHVEQWDSILAHEEHTDVRRNLIALIHELPPATGPSAPSTCPNS